MDISERLFNRLMFGVVLLGFLALIVAGGAAGWVVARNQDFTGWVNHTYQVEQALSDFRLTLERTDTARRGDLLSPTPTFRQTYEIAAAQLPTQMRRIGELTADNPRQQQRVARGEALIEQLLSALDASIALVDAGQAEQARGQFRTDAGVPSMRALRALAVDMADEEAALLKVRDQAQRDSARMLIAVMIGSGVILVLVAVSSLWVILRYTRDLTASRDQLRALNDNLEGVVVERTADIQRANDEIQRFAYIVSHDLRSPLVNVMGFTAELDVAAKPMAAFLDRIDRAAPELADDEVRQAVKVDLPEAVGFIRSSTQKMDRLINAILRLSREGRRVITPEPLDMTALLTGVADTLRHQAVEAGAEIDIQAPLPTIVSDRLAIEQIFANLVENAVKYAAKDRPGRIRVRGREQGDQVIFEVQDNGRGIDPKDHDRIFDLFRRSGAQDKPGEGIGLAHVRALAYRLDGLITCDSALDQGATFRLCLPKFLNQERGAPS